MIWYFALRAADVFYSHKFRYPGSFTNNAPASSEALAKDAHDVFQYLHELCTTTCLVPAESLQSLTNPGSLAEDGSEPIITKDHAIEITRDGGIELHNISSLIGGIAAQEAVKVITNIYQPLNNTYVFNGIQSCGATYVL